MDGSLGIKGTRSFNSKPPLASFSCQYSWKTARPSCRCLLRSPPCPMVVSGKGRYFDGHLRHHHGMTSLLTGQTAEPGIKKGEENNRGRGAAVDKRGIFGPRGVDKGFVSLALQYSWGISGTAQISRHAPHGRRSARSLFYRGQTTRGSRRERPGGRRTGLMVILITRTMTMTSTQRRPMGRR
ncbi:hypothetical protein Naga_100226g5 [Nannochloropsis gaditana]|uniref:Uncharacterized protein n=1 Tax=Nannochloropsis gaditana TaxID=72520 RepID=W7TMP5_9STRA|nr:hypothetical protein Naga_100226g5 [Nannochloropsis gaditana]